MGSGKRRILEFYPGARIDGLVHREDIFGRKVNELFSHHDEGLQRRSIHYTLPEEKRKAVEDKYDEKWVPDPSCTEIHKVKEVYEKKPVPCGEETTAESTGIAQIKYMVASGQVWRIEVDYHYKPCRIVHDRRVYSKDKLIEEELVQVDPFAEALKPAQTNDDLMGPVHEYRGQPGSAGLTRVLVPLMASMTLWLLRTLEMAFLGRRECGRRQSSGEV